MTRDETNEFVERNPDRINEYFNLLINKLKETSLKIDRLSLLLGLLLLLYYLIDLKSISTFSLGPIEISDQTVIKLLVPLVFSYIFLQFATLNAHRGQLLKATRQIGKLLYNLHGIKAEESMYSNQFLRLIMAYSTWDELNSVFLRNGKFNWLTFILTSPLFLLILVPFIFEYILIRDLMLGYWHDGLLQKAITILSIWLFIVIIVYYIRLLKLSFSEALADNKALLRK